MTDFAASQAGQGSTKLALRSIVAFCVRSFHRQRMGPVVTIGYGGLVRRSADGYGVEGVDVSWEQVTITRAPRVGHVIQDDDRNVQSVHLGQLAAVTAANLLEHMTTNEVLETIDTVRGVPALSYEYPKVLDLPGTPL